MKIFLSAVSGQFTACRGALRNDLSAVGAEVVVQEAFQQHGASLLGKLERYIASCDRVIALVGDAYGFEPEEMARPAGRPRRSYTQWEYYFAKGERLNGSRQPPKDIFLYFASPEFLAMYPVSQADDAAQLQREFIQELVQSGKDRNQFRVLDELRALVLRDGFRLPVGTGPINQSLNTLALLMQFPEVRQTATRFRGDFEDAKQAIEVLRAYKDLHDGLHKLEIDCYDLIMIEIGFFPSSEEGIGNLRIYLQKLQELLYDLRQVVARRRIREEETSWIEQQLEPARQAILLALNRHHKEELENAAYELSLILASRPSMINTSLYKTVDSLKLPKLLNALNVLSDRMTHLRLETLDLARFQEGIDHLLALSTRLETLIKLHNTLQGIDNELRHIAVSMARDTPPEGARYLQASWRILKAQVQSLRGDQSDPYTEGLQAYAGNLESALDKGVGIQIQREFRNFLGQSRLVFFRVDSWLKAECDRLPGLAEPLDRVLERMQ